MVKLIKITRKKDSQGIANYSLTFKGAIEEISQTSLLSLLNAGDNRFNQQNNQLAWINKATAEGIKNVFGVEAKDLPEVIGGDREFDLELPSFKLELKETTTVPKYIFDSATDEDNFTTLVASRCKQIKDSSTQEVSYFLSKDLKAVFREVNVVNYEPKHTRVELLVGEDGKTLALDEDEFAEKCKTFAEYSQAKTTQIIVEGAKQLA